MHFVWCIPLGPNEVRQYNSGPDHPFALVYRDLRLSDSSSLGSHCHEIQSSIELSEGPLMKLGLFDLSDGSRLLIVIHHLVIDGFSWRILFEDIDTLYQQLDSGEELSLPLKTDSFQRWSAGLATYMEGVTYESSRQYWSNHEPSGAQIGLIPQNPGGSNRRKDISHVSFELSEEKTEALLGAVHRAFTTQINDLLLAALYQSIKDHFGEGSLEIDMESHGREEIDEGVDVSRTVGWFTSIYPIYLEGGGEGLSGLLKSVKESLRRVPRKGFDYLLYRYLDPAWGSGQVQEGGPPQISFNYLDQLDKNTGDRAILG